MEATGYRDPVAGCAVVITTPQADPRLWREYLAGAVRSYTAHGVEHALEYAEMQDGQSTSLLFAAMDDHGVMVGGIRSQGPYDSVEETHAIREWSDKPGESQLRAALAALIPEGLVELKAAWVADDHPSRRELASCLSRTPIHAASVLGARYAFGTAAAHAVPGWVAAGGIVAPDVPAVAYPDERYRTRLVYWDRHDLLGRLDDQEREKFLSESAQLQTPGAPTPRCASDGATPLVVGSRRGVASDQGATPRDRSIE